MFPNLDDYNIRDIRDMALYVWSHELFALKELIESTNNYFTERIKLKGEQAIECSSSNSFEKSSELLLELESYRTLMPLAFQSYVLSLYSVVEASMNRFCEVCKEKYKLKIELEDLNDKGVTRAVTYLEKVLEVENIKSDNKWAEMVIVNQLRNDIIHNCGRVGSEKKIKSYSEKLGVEVENGKVYIAYENIIKTYNIIDRFMTFIFTRNFIDKSKSFKI